MKSLSLSQPHLLITVGIPGSGKSHFARQFSNTFQTPYVKYDSILDISGGNSSLSDILAGYMLQELFKTGHTIMFDGSSASVDERAALTELASAAGYACLFIWVQTDSATAKARFLKESRKIGRHATGAQHDGLTREFAPPQPKEGNVVVISGKHTYATQLKAVLKNLSTIKQVARAKTSNSHAGLTTSRRRTIQ